jgi:serine/threonine protein kinase
MRMKTNSYVVNSRSYTYFMKDLLSNLESHSDFRNLSLSNLTGGYRNETILCAEKGLVIKYHSINEITALKFLRKTQYPHSLELKYVDKEIYGVDYFQNSRNLFELINGNELNLEEANKLFFEIGSALKLLHSIPLEKLENKINVKEIPENISFIKKELTEKVFNFINKINSSELVISHGDFGPQQIVYNSQSKVFRIIDWEDFSLCHPYFDVASFAWTTKFHFKEIYESLIENFINGYFGNISFDPELMKCFSILRMWTSLPHFESLNKKIQQKWILRLEDNLKSDFI